MVARFRPRTAVALLALLTVAACSGGGEGGDEMTIAETLEAFALRAADLGREEPLPLASEGSSLDRATLDLCGTDYPSEGDRVARRFVLTQESDVTGNENVAYASPDAAEEAFAQVRERVARCDPQELTPGPVAGVSGYRSDLMIEDVEVGSGVDDSLAVTGTLTFEGRDPVASATVLVRRGRLVGIVYGGELDEIRDAARLVAERLADLPDSAVRG